MVFDEWGSSPDRVNNCAGWAGPCKQLACVWFIIRPNGRLSSGAGERRSRVPRITGDRVWSRVFPAVMKGCWSQIMKRILEHRNRPAWLVVPLLIAIVGGEDAHQCLKCCKYFTSLRNFKKHARNIRQCHLSDSATAPSFNGKAGSKR